jgi:hypothetical protein
MRAPLVLLAGILFGCTPKTPQGFSGGSDERWDLPLVGPLEDGLLLTSVIIGSHGPYVFAIDPDATMSVVDADVVKEAQLRTFNGPSRLDESGAPQPRIYAEMINVEIGPLIIERRDVMVVRSNTFDSGGRRIHGVVGRDVLSNELVFGFKRDRGLAILQTKSSWKPPAGALAVKFEPQPIKIPNIENPPVPRQIVKATVNGQPFNMHVDLGAVVSQLRDQHWETGKLVAKELEGAVVDDTGSVRKLDKASEPTHAELAGIANDKVIFVPYTDKRWDSPDVDGALGLGFFVGYDVWVDFEGRTMYFEKRADATYATRIGRWDFGPIAKCEHPGCVTVRIVDPMAGKQPEEGKTHPGVVLSITRDERAGGTDLEVVLEPKDKPELPRLIVNLPPNSDRLIDHLPPEWIGVTLDVIDASPFPRKCSQPGGCVDRYAK